MTKWKPCAVQVAKAKDQGVERAEYKQASLQKFSVVGDKLEGMSKSKDSKGNNVSH